MAETRPLKARKFMPVKAGRTVKPIFKAKKSGLLKFSGLGALGGRIVRRKK